MEEFWNKESEFLRWMVRNRKGYVVNCYKSRGRSGGPYMLHRADCYTMTNKNLTTGQYYKMCSEDRNELIRWANREQDTNGYDEMQRCKKCNP